MDEDDIQAVVDVLRSQWLTTGPKVEAFEQALAAATGAQHCAVLSSGTAALHAAYAAAGLGPGNELICPTLSFVATASAALLLGADVRLADVRPDTGNVDPADIERLITPRTKVVVGVDFGGCAADYDAIREVIGGRDILLVSDAAHSLGARRAGKPVGTLADVTVTSFHAVKPITTAEGGAVFSGDPRFDKKVRLFRNHGMNRDVAAARQPGREWYYEVGSLGLNYRLPDLLCALGISQLAKLERFTARRRQIAETYIDRFQNIAGFSTPHVPSEVESAWHLFPIRVEDPARRDPLFAALRQAGLMVQVHYRPIHLHPALAGLARSGNWPVAERIGACSISLPLFPAMADADVERVVEIMIDRARALL